MYVSGKSNFAIIFACMFFLLLVCVLFLWIYTQIARFVGPTWGPPGSCRSQMAPCWPHEPCYQRNIVSYFAVMNSEGTTAYTTYSLHPKIIHCTFYGPDVMLGFQIFGNTVFITIMHCTCFCFVLKNTENATMYVMCAFARWFSITTMIRFMRRMCLQKAQNINIHDCIKIYSRSICD